MRIIKAGLIAVCLLALHACSTNEAQPVVLNTPLLCPQVSECKAQTPHITTNKDLVMALDNALNGLEQCEIINRTLQNCIAHYNNGAKQ
ncbi:Rz1-like lysis system protein LysC [Spirabiliibacterium mucosae]|uniref:Rz1-like lysis system protein LysC n=1 Tax=Spirabiliibacterium mucosae TaxID=28156 RepID=UPI001F35B62B|nr:Rz1-like lysis system protein LysC [Spirabiliibacterium mucosae]